MGEGPNDAGLSRTHIIARVRGQPEAPADRLDRPLPGARVGRPDAARGDAGGARHARARRARSATSAARTSRALAHDEGARRRRARRPTSASSASRSTTRCRRARRSTSSCRPRSTRALGILVWSPLAGGLLSGKYRRGSEAPEGSRHLTDWDEPPIRDAGQALRHRRGAGRDRRGAQRLGGAGRARLAARPAGRDLGDHRRAHAGAVRRQPRGRRPGADRRGACSASMRSSARRCSIPTGTRRPRRQTGSARPI